jgi:glyoxylase-like metal-dependent hydrolase (beta-lactamase superfamily II)
MTVDTGAASAFTMRDFAPVPESSLGPVVNEQGYYVGRVERNLYWVTDGVYQCGFLTTPDGVILLDAPATLGHNIQRAIDEITSANGVSNKVTYLIHSHHHADHASASSLFGTDVVRVGHEETRKLMLRDNDPNRPAPEDVSGSSHSGDWWRAHRTRLARLQPLARQQLHLPAQPRHVDAR